VPRVHPGFGGCKLIGRRANANSCAPPGGSGTFAPSKPRTTPAVRLGIKNPIRVELSYRFRPPEASSASVGLSFAVRMRYSVLPLYIASMAADDDVWKILVNIYEMV